MKFIKMKRVLKLSGTEINEQNVLKLCSKVVLHVVVIEFPTFILL